MSNMHSTTQHMVEFESKYSCRVGHLLPPGGAESHLGLTYKKSAIQKVQEILVSHGLSEYGQQEERVPRGHFEMRGGNA